MLVSSVYPARRIKLTNIETHNIHCSEDYVVAIFGFPSCTSSQEEEEEEEEEKLKWLIFCLK